MTHLQLEPKTFVNPVVKLNQSFAFGTYQSLIAFM